jgi:hypothetical protein
LVIEVTSSITQDEDNQKKRCYESLESRSISVRPMGDYLSLRLQSYRLVRNRYEPIRPRPDGSLESRTTGLTLTVEGLHLRLIDTATGEQLLRVSELGEKLGEERAARYPPACRTETWIGHPVR